jgi:hypothetical protein
MFALPPDKGAVNGREGGRHRHRWRKEAERKANLKAVRWHG